MADYPEVEEAIIYGSRAMGTFRNGSDIDLVLIGNKLSLSILSKLENDLDDLMLPYQFDIAIYHQIGNDELLEHIHRAGASIYKKSDFR